jgi:hypothetical protein
VKIFLLNVNIDKYVVTTTSLKTGGWKTKFNSHEMKRWRSSSTQEVQQQHMEAMKRVTYGAQIWTLIKADISRLTVGTEGETEMENKKQKLCYNLKINSLEGKLTNKRIIWNEHV